MRMFAKELKEIASLKDNWDGKGALPIPKKTIKNAKAFLDYYSFYFLWGECEIKARNNPIAGSANNVTISVENLLKLNLFNIHLYFEIGDTLYTGFMKINGHRPFRIKGKCEELYSAS